MSLTDDTRSVNYDRNTFIIQATGQMWASPILIVYANTGVNYAKKFYKIGQDRIGMRIKQ
jgi:hypothetical protein